MWMHLVQSTLRILLSRLEPYVDLEMFSAKPYDGFLYVRLFEIDPFLLSFV